MDTAAPFHPVWRCGCCWSACSPLRLLRRLADVRRHGYPDPQGNGAQRSEFGLLTATPVLTGALVSTASGHLDGPVRRPHRHVHPLIACAVPLWLCLTPRHFGSSCCWGWHLGWSVLRLQLARPIPRGFSQRRRKVSRWEYSAPAQPGPPSTCSGAAVGGRLWVAERAPGLCRCPADHRGAVLAAFVAGTRAVRERDADPATTRGSARSPRLEISPVLLDCVRRIHGGIRLDAAYFVNEFISRSVRPR